MGKSGREVRLCCQLNELFHYVSLCFSLLVFLSLSFSHNLSLSLSVCVCVCVCLCACVYKAERVGDVQNMSVSERERENKYDLLV